MIHFHAVVWIDHQNAQILQFDAEQVQASKVKAHSHPTGQHGSAVRTQHEFFGQVCDALAGIPEVLAVGPRTGLSDFEHYLKKHRTETAARVLGFEVSDHLSEIQRVALARKIFLRIGRMNGTPVPS